MFLDTVAYLRTIDALPVILRLSTEETAENIARHNAGWHKSCRNKFSKSKVQRNMFIASHRKRKLPKVEDERRLCKRIFCEQEHKIEQLSSVQTFEQDSNIRPMATDWQDVEIMAIISGRDMIAIEAKSTGQKKLLTGVEQDWKILAKASYKKRRLPRCVCQHSQIHKGD